MFFRVVCGIQDWYTYGLTELYIKYPITFPTYIQLLAYNTAFSTLSSQNIFLPTCSRSHSSPKLLLLSLPLSMLLSLGVMLTGISLIP